MSAPPVVFLPGASGHHRVWEAVAQRLNPSRTTMLVDYPGLGDCAPHGAITSLADLYETVMARLPEHCDLVALSMGCVLALRAAIEQAPRIRRLVLVATSGGADLAPLGAADWRPKFSAQRPDAPTWFLNDRTDLTDRLHLVAAPTLLIFGDRDPIAPPPVGHFLRGRLPSAELRSVTGGTHDLTQEHATLVAELIDAHLGPL